MKKESNGMNWLSLLNQESKFFFFYKTDQKANINNILRQTFFINIFDYKTF